MIDYDKLKIAHALATNSEAYYFSISFGMDNGTITLFDANKNDDQFIYDTENIDDLITKLRELTQPEPKYKEADHIWRIVNNLPFEDIICEHLDCDINGEQCYSIKGLIIGESKLYPAKAALIENQIEYWRRLQCESDIHFYDTTINGKIACVYCEKPLFDRDEYCNVSGAKLGKREEQGATGCEHESNPDAGQMIGTQWALRCKKCGDFYR
jgi:hypothetical protein